MRSWETGAFAYGAMGSILSFFKRNGMLLTRLLDERFDEAVTEHGLVNFFDALEENNHWVMLEQFSIN